MTLERYGQMCSMSILGHGEKEEGENPKLETFDESCVCEGLERNWTVGTSLNIVRMELKI